MIALRFWQVVYSTWLVYQDEAFWFYPGTSGRPGSFEHIPDVPGDTAPDIRDFSPGRL